MRTRYKYLLVVLLGFAALAALVFFGIRAFAASEVHKFLNARNIPVSSLTLEKITANEIILRDVAIGENDVVKAKTIHLTRLSGTTLETMQVKLHAEGVQVRGKNSAFGWTFGRVEKIFPAKANPKERKTFTAASLHIVDATVDAAGSLTGDVDAILNAKTFHYRNGADHLHLSGITMKPTYRAQPRMATIPITVKSASFSNEKGAVFTPLSLVSALTLDIKKNRLNGDFSGTDATKKFMLSGALSYGVVSGKGTVNIRTNDVIMGMDEGQLTLTNLLPMMDSERATPAMRGTLESTVTLGKLGYESVKGLFTITSLDSGGLLKDALGEHATLVGLMKGTLPFTITPTGWQVTGGNLLNNGPMKLTMLQQKEAETASTVATLLGKNVPQGALDAVNIAVLDLHALSTNDKGDITLKGKLQGNNAVLARDVIINVNLSTNLMDMLKSLSVTSKVMK